MKRKHNLKNALKAMTCAMFLLFAACLSMEMTNVYADGETESASLPGDVENPENGTEAEEPGIWPVDIDRTDCSITLTLQYHDTNGNAFQMVGGTVALYKAAGVKEDNGYVYDVTMGRFAEVEGMDAIAAMKTSDLATNNALLAMRLEAEALKMEPDAQVDITDGSVSFTGLTPGLYLIVQTKASEKSIQMNPFLMSIPNANGEYEVNASPKPGIMVPPPGNIPETTPEETPPETTPSEPTIPETGQNWWPVMIMGVIGFLLILTGAIVWKREKENQ